MIIEQFFKSFCTVSCWFTVIEIIFSFATCCTSEILFFNKIYVYIYKHNFNMNQFVLNGLCYIYTNGQSFRIIFWNQISHILNSN